MSEQRNSSLYLELFHGRRNPKINPEDWGEPGPVFGPFSWVHTTYALHIKCGYPFLELFIHNYMVYYDGVWYGDWTVFSSDVLERIDGLQEKLVPWNRALTCLPKECHGKKSKG